MMQAALRAQEIPVTSVAQLSSVSEAPFPTGLQLALPLAAIIVITVAGMLVATLLGKLIFVWCRPCSCLWNQKNQPLHPAVTVEDPTSWLQPVSTCRFFLLSDTKMDKKPTQNVSSCGESSTKSSPEEAPMWHTPLAQPCTDKAALATASSYQFAMDPLNAVDGRDISRALHHLPSIKTRIGHQQEGPRLAH